MRLWDMSPPVSAASPVYPGDAPYSRRWTARLGVDGAPASVSAITLSPHVGAHADAPLHYDDAGAAVGALDLAPFLGRCRVVHAIGRGPLIGVEHLWHAAPDLPPRVLVRTCERAATAWRDDFAAFAPQTIEWLAARGVTLIGIDTPSVDPASSTTLDSHHALRRLDLRVLENLVLDGVPEGDYELIALPLKLMDAEASPVRAVLRDSIHPYNVCMRFEWDPVKAASNAKKHKVTFELAKTVFYDDFAIQFFDDEHSFDEDRFLMLGMSSDARLLLVCQCEREDGNIVRIISARKATEIEARYYRGE